MRGLALEKASHALLMLHTKKCTSCLTRALTYACAPARTHTHLLLQRAVEDEDEHALEGVEGSEEVRHDDRVLVDEEEAKGPGQAEEEEQGDGPQCPGPERHAHHRSASLLSEGGGLSKLTLDQ